MRNGDGKEVAGDKERDGESNKSYDNGNEEGNGIGGKTNGDGIKEGNHDGRRGQEMAILFFFRMVLNLEQQILVLFLVLPIK